MKHISLADLTAENFKKLNDLYKQRTGVMYKADDYFFPTIEDGLRVAYVQVETGHADPLVSMTVEVGFNDGVVAVLNSFMTGAEGDVKEQEANDYHVHVYGGTFYSSTGDLAGSVNRVSKRGKTSLENEDYSRERTGGNFISELQLVRRLHLFGWMDFILQGFGSSQYYGNECAEVDILARDVLNLLRTDMEETDVQHQEQLPEGPHRVGFTYGSPVWVIPNS